MSDMGNIISGTEEGWRSASTDSRRHDKHRVIKGLVDKMVANRERDKQSQEDAFYEDLVEAAGPVVHAGLERQGSTVGYSRRFAQMFDKAFRGE